MALKLLYLSQEHIKMKLKLSIALLLTMLPSLAFARTHESSPHQRPKLYHDRSPKPHVERVSKPRY
jgi:hypothetical protein